MPQEPEKNKKKIATTRTRTCFYSSIIIYSDVTRENSKTQPSGTTVSNFQRRCRGPSRAPKLLSLCLTVVRAPRSPSQGGRLLDRRCGWSYDGRITEYRTRKIQKYRGRGASGCGFVPRIGNLFYFFLGDAKQVPSRFQPRPLLSLYFQAERGRQISVSTLRRSNGFRRSSSTHAFVVISRSSHG